MTPPYRGAVLGATMNKVSRSALIAGFLGLAMLAAQAGPASHLLAKPLKPNPLKGKPGTNILAVPIKAGQLITAFNCGDPCTIPIRVIYVPASGTDPARCEFNYAEVALTVIPRTASKVIWRVEAWTQSGTHKFTFVPDDGIAKRYGVLITDNTEPIDPTQPMGQRRTVWLNDPATTTPTDVVKTIATNSADRRFKASAFLAYVQWELVSPSVGKPTACGEMDPIIMNDGS